MPTRDTTGEDCDTADESDADAEIPALAWRPEDMRALLQRSHTADTCNTATVKRVWVRTKSARIQALSIVESMWGSAEAWPVSSINKDSGPRHIREAAAHVAARNKKNNDQQEVCP